ncbi:hypothetical protein Cpap_0068 [Ruminiclostridium papyrosolvens DSM 2782]|uniref:Uncharacterized protein n=1 Tax=Ruminiclostridium papyrosolvens DSM 2782 TaxID=588581 RepID=F1TIP1_9FIRM|nr:hypothetical protein [Ruminiclostridium papyrosolvens]EGD45740.1 hypothetical protein Cpap_0068 [Ruminiclostridium papyrosolvens DSM 2782]WES35327.1 hypothetical protein P0092_04945 [Ruminiclostridium papyrosolvens DSM 2782]
MSGNPTAGVGDPYWYEWSVGLLYTLDMLIPGKNIRHVILQCAAMQGLDDIVVVHENNQAECIQIKHTRESDTFTFSDAIDLLKSMISDWNNAKSQGYSHRSAILFTNRTIGTQRSTSKDGTKLPSLDEFWDSLQEQSNKAKAISEITFEPEWEAAWKKWLSELSEFSDEEKLEFLKDLKLITNQDGLMEIYRNISNKLKECFHVNERTATQLHQKLTYALMTWTTTIRFKEEITKEDLLQALSLSGDKIVGEHSLPTCEPFFESRADFAKTLEAILAERRNPIVFLSGGPGSGKTNIINYLSNKSDSVITLRFHAFKPLNAKDEYLTADKGISDPRALWGNLLIELREIFVKYDRMSDYNVPPTIELMESVDALRGEVLRLSDILGTLTGRTTVIAIDGIDHAARSGETNTFLGTLIPPESVPNQVCFLIAGQPVSEYSEYPYFIADTSRVLTLDVPCILENDVAQLYDSSDIKIPADGRDAAIRIIYGASAGNTLSAVFAVQEAKRFESIEELEEQLETKHLARGIESYYNYIWKAAIDAIPKEYTFVDMMLAGTLSLFNKQITPAMLQSICPDAEISLLAWRRIIQKLYPIIVTSSDDGYVVFHNDVRIYLGKYLRKEPGILSEVSGRLADFLLSGPCDIKTKHELTFDFLQNAHREKEFIDIFNRQYVTEALGIKRPMGEIVAQLEATLNSLNQISDYSKVLSLSCAVATLHQFNQSLQWMDQQYSGEIEVPAALFSERKVVQREFLTANILYSMLGNTMFLILYGEISRAESNIRRWLGTLDPGAVAELLYTNCGSKATADDFEKEMSRMMELWGRVSQYTGILFSSIDHTDSSEIIKRAYADYAKGWLDEGTNFLTPERIKNTLGQLGIHYRKDIHGYLMSILASEQDEAINVIFDSAKEHPNSNEIKLQLTMWAMQNDLQEQCSEWISEIQSQKFGYINKSAFEYQKEVFPYYCKIVYVFAYCEDIDIRTTSKACLLAFKEKDFSPKDRGYFAAQHLIQMSAFLGRLNRCINIGETSSIRVSDFCAILGQLLNYRDWINRYEVSGFNIEADLLNSIIRMYPKMDAEFRKAVDSMFSSRVEDYEHIEHLNIYWNHLKLHGQHGLLEQLFDNWMNPTGLVWDKELYEINEIATDFIEKATELGWKDRVIEAQKLLDSRIVGYVGRKDYSLYYLMNWYKHISIFDDSHWKTEGVLLLNISKIASETGDNRAAVYIDASVAESAGRLSADDLWKFANLSAQWDSYWVGVIFDGIIAALEFGSFSEAELLEIWSVATEIFFISEHASEYDSNNNKNRIYIADIKEAIILASNRLEYCNIADSMQKKSPLAFTQTRRSRTEHSFIIPRRWYEDDPYYNEGVVDKYLDEINALSCSEAFVVLNKLFQHEKSDFRWDIVISFIKKVERESRENILTYIPVIVDMLMQRHDAYYWEWDGANRLFEEIFKYFDKDQMTLILKDIVEKYFIYSNKHNDNNFFGLNSDLESFALFYYASLAEDANVNGFNEVAQMHMDWITGNQILSVRQQYSIQPGFVAENWSDFCKKLIKRCMKQRNY